jgi:small subunit ribosomal protein S7
MSILREAILLASPAIKTITHARGANNFLIPVALSEKQRTRRDIQWLLEDAAHRPKLAARLAREMIGVLQEVVENRKPHNREQTWSGALEKENLLHKTTMVSRCVAWCFFLVFHG